MNRKDKQYQDYSLVEEMLETSEIIRSFPSDEVRSLPVTSHRVLLTGEGSSRLFPAKRIATSASMNGYEHRFLVEGALQAREYDLSDFHAFVASNSGKTAEGVEFIRHVRANKRIAGLTGIVGNGEAPIAREADRSYTLHCGKENAVAATKSVIEQALVYETLFRSLNERPEIDYESLADSFEEVLTMRIDRLIVDRLALAPRFYFAGRNDGVAEELTLKTNEITRRTSDFLEGTYAVHGIEEVMQPNEVVIVIDPWKEQEEKFHTVLEEGVGLTVIAISSRETSFPTVRIPRSEQFEPYLQLAAGWNLLVEMGLRIGVDIDTPQRARKVGNEFITTG